MGKFVLLYLCFNTPYSVPGSNIMGESNVVNTAMNYLIGINRTQVAGTYIKLASSTVFKQK
jgi:hypothetical protein